jgi:molybdate transport system permease protein
MTDIVQLTTFTLLTGLGATVVALPFGVAIAWVLARRQFAGKAVIETLVSLPLVLPPVATGLILL